MPNVVIIRFKANLKAGIKYDEQAKVHVTYAPALQLYSQGTTPLEAKVALADAVQMFLNVAYDRGILEKVLQLTGFTRSTGKSTPRTEAEEEYIEVIEQEVLQKNNFQDIFDVPASLPLMPRSQPALV